ncbi:MAG: hypothetical protein JKP97_19860 [Rhodobacteraceae bacterium]|jgi:hypothetical protein|nr:hypothetical protein [Paracoccaceae bacterium]
MTQDTNRAVIAIDMLKKRFGVSSDADLARSLKVSHSAIVSWRKKGAVPDRYLTAGPGNVSYSFTTAPMLWNDEEQHALPLALARLFRDHGDKYASFEKFAIGQPLISTSLWMYLAEAVRELREHCDRTGDHPRMAMLIVARDTIGKPAAHPPFVQVSVTRGGAEE